MRKFVILSLTVLAVASCSRDMGNYGTPQIDVSALPEKDPNAITKEDIAANDANIFGAIDPNQDWKTISHGSVSITADADLTDIAKVQTLSESPFFNSDPRILAEATAKKGETVTLDFEAPNGYSKLVAACLSSEGRYYIKGFEVGAKAVSFGKMSRSRTRGAANDITFSSPITLPIDFSSPSFNAIRTIKANEGETGTGTNDWDKITPWKNAGWQAERLWRLAPNASAKSGEWYVNEIAGKSNNWEKPDGIRRNLSDISSDEEAELNTIFNRDLTANDVNNNPINNLEKIYKSNIFSLQHNNLTSSGKPLTIIPVQKYSSEINSCELFYYYYNPDWIAGKSSDEAVQFIRDLPKFKATKCSETGNATGRTDFYRDYEYLLPYYGDAPLFGMETLSGYQSDGKLYRIKNGFQVDGEDYYFCYQASSPQARVLSKSELEMGNAEGLGYWLWMIFRNAEGNCFFYNVGARTFVYFKTGNQPGYNICSWTLLWTPDNYLMPDTNPFKLVDKGEGWYNILRTDNYNNKGLGTDLNKYVNDKKTADNRGVWADKNNGDLAKWFFEEYTGERLSDLKANLPAEVKKATTDAVAMKSAIIPQGYKVGFMIKKSMNYTNTWRTFYYNWSSKEKFADLGPYTNGNNGELYGDGRLNYETNQFGMFNNAVRNKQRNMPLDCSRIAMFTANNKTYLAFEEGSDVNFNDFIVEINDGVELIDEQYGIDRISYTMCFEDRPLADYDMNDAALRFSRLNPTQVEVSLIACGAYDELYLRGLNGQRLNELTEIHAIFGVDNHATYINTDGSLTIDPVTEIFEIDPNKRLSEFMEKIYIYDATTGQEVKLSGKGDSPHAIVVPTDFNYPMEKQCITKAYPLFLNWVKKAEDDRFWFQTAQEEFIYKIK